MMPFPLLMSAALLALLPGSLLAEADGPDHFEVSGISAGNILNIHSSKNTGATVIGMIPPHGGCIRNLGCQGGLTLDEFTTLSKPEQTQRLLKNPRWCKIDYQGITGWVTGRYLIEGHCKRETTVEQNALPGFDCSKASGSVEELICKQPSLARLDRQMAGTFRAALQRFRLENYDDPRPEQRGWIKGRNDCWKADDVHQCVLSAYRYRMAELQIHYGQLEVPAPVYFDCDNTALTAVYYSQTIPPTVALTIIPVIQGINQVLAYQEPSASGAKYQGRNVSFWEHQGEAKLDWYDKQMTCRVKR